MHGVNLDLLRATVAHHPDGRPKDPHAHHTAAHLDALRAARAEGRQSRGRRIFALIRKLVRRQAKPSLCP
ncbi:MAG: hypothetical protein U1E69_02030 [Tabrizicola sp.]|uniref:hypothetical protein n=1 Tax=Tabrizicola sp. TaxID=2005166 RepID=UPI002ABC7A6C|nr:hypothetical protein [Tabrizicola sp.]MDZ4085558.1 hypothetical protein [Tabrizicola sp.]